MKEIIGIAFAAAIATSSDASAQSYRFEDVKTGTLSGKLIVQWLEPDLFLFIPDKDAPLSFTRHSGQRITPGRMKTDGGTIPRGFWILRSYSPWGFAPAFVVHDWLFEVKRCKYSGHEQLSLLDSALIMAEIMKTMIQAKKVDASSLVVDSMYLATTSDKAQQYWGTGSCTPPVPALFPQKPILEYEISY